MSKLKIVGLELSIAIVALGLGFGFCSSNALADGDHHSYRGSGAMNEKELVDAVKRTNAGWDWVPRCANGAHWSWNDNRCKGGTKHHHDHHDHHHHHHD